MDEGSFLLPNNDKDARRLFRTTYASISSRSGHELTQPRIKILSTRSGILASQLEVILNCLKLLLIFFLQESVVSTVGTSYGPIRIQTSLRSLIQTTRRGRAGILLGLVLAFISAVLCAANHFLFQFRRMNTTDMMVARGVLQSLFLGLLTLATARCYTFKLSSYSDALLVLCQGNVS